MATNSNNNGETFSMNSNLFPVVCVQMYETQLSPMAYEDYMRELDKGEPDGDFTYYTVDYNDWKKELTTIATNYIRHNFLPVLRKYGVEDIKGTGIWSPREYNFTGDALDMEITMQQGWEAIMERSLQTFAEITDCRKYVCDNWHSRSGFISFMPETVEDVLTESDDERRLAAYLTLALVYEDVLETAGDSLENIWEAGMYEFSDYEHINVLDEYMNDENETQRLIDLWNDDDRFNELYWQLANKLGFPWLHEPETMALEGKKDSDYNFNADSAGKRLLFWAAIHQHTVSDLYSMAA